jgi:hypothetical protein
MNCIKYSRDGQGPRDDHAWTGSALILHPEDCAAKMQHGCRCVCRRIRCFIKCMKSGLEQTMGHVISSCLEDWEEFEADCTWTAAPHSCNSCTLSIFPLLIQRHFCRRCAAARAAGGPRSPITFGHPYPHSLLPAQPITARLIPRGCLIQTLVRKKCPVRM